MTLEFKFMHCLHHVHNETMREGYGYRGKRDRTSGG